MLCAAEQSEKYYEFSLIAEVITNQKLFYPLYVQNNQIYHDLVFRFLISDKISGQLPYIMSHYLNFIF